MYDVWHAFEELHFCRTAGFGLNPIQISEIDAWLRLNGVDDKKEKLEYCYFIKELDKRFMKWNNEKRKNKE